MSLRNIDNSTRQDMLVGSLLPEQTVPPVLQLEVHTKDFKLERTEENAGSSVRCKKVPMITYCGRTHIFGNGAGCFSSTQLQASRTCLTLTALHIESAPECGRETFGK